MTEQIDNVAPLLAAENINSLGNAKINHNLTVGGQISVAGAINSNNANISGVTGVVTLHASSVVSRGPVTAGSLITAGIVTATGNVAGANIFATGLISASANITGGNLKILGNTIAIGNINSVGNITTPVGAVTSNSVVALTVLQLPVYTDENARDQAIADPAIGMMVVVGNTFQGYANGRWGNLTLS